MKITVNNEVSETKSVNVIRSDGAMRILQGTAASSVIPEMSVFGSGRAVHVFDASAKVNAEPAQSNAFLIVTSCRNTKNYAQTEQRNILRYVIPSYTLQELSPYSGYFGVGLKELAARCFEIGPSFYTIVGNDYAQTMKMTEAKANSISADQMDRYIDNNFFQISLQA